MDWLLVAVLGIIWAALLLPRPSRRRDGIAPGDYSVFTEPGRRVLMPRRGKPFLGPSDRARARARERRRKVFMLLLEGVGLTAVIGLFPPTRGMWVVTGILVVLLIAYVAMLLQLREREAPAVAAQLQVDVAPPPQALAETVPGEPRVVVIRDEYAPRRAGVAG